MNETYTVEAERDETGWWVVTVPALPSVVTQGRNLAKVREHAREAIAVTLEVDRDVDNVDVETIGVDVRVQLPSAARALVTEAEAARAAAVAARHAAHQQTRTAARELTRLGLSMRDTADVLGLSHQRVQQLLSEAAPPAVETAPARRRRAS